MAPKAIEPSVKVGSVTTTATYDTQERRELPYELPRYDKANARLESIKRELKLINESSVTSREEGFKETLTLHRLGLSEKLGQRFKNCRRRK